MLITHSIHNVSTVIYNTYFTYPSSAGFYEFKAHDHVLITHPMKHAPDIIKTTNQPVNMSSSIPQFDQASTGDWFYNNLTKEMTYIVTGETGTSVQDINLQVRTITIILIIIR